MRIPQAFASLVLISGIGCGGGGQSTPSTSSSGGQAAPASSAAPQATPGAAQGLSQVAQSQAKPVDFELLKGLLPEMSGWTRTRPRGEQMNMPFAISNAKAHYTMGESTMDIEITDSALNQMIFAPFAMFMASGYEERSDDGYKKAGTIAGSPGFESWEKDAKRGEVTVIVANRFVVQAKGRRVPSVDPVKKAIETIDLAKLATLK
jgi:hypothetical protein